MPVDLSFQVAEDNWPLTRRRICEHVQWLLNQLNVADHTVSLLFVDDEEISWMNSKYRGKEGPTNVLSFPLAEKDDSPLSSLEIFELGDIVISLETARREAISYGQSFTYRLNWLIIHGLLHLLGYDHERSAKDARLMEEKEQQLLQRLEHKRRNRMPRLAINVDHVATIRQARGGDEPDPVSAAAICEMAGAAGIVIHLREDRRHIQDRDVRLLRETVKTRLNLEMGATKEIINIALQTEPDMVTLVPEKRQELTTEGGLDVVAGKKKIGAAIKKLAAKNIPVSIFVDPDHKQVKAALDVGATYVEIHTGRYSDAISDAEQEEEFTLIESTAEHAFQLGLRVNAGHGLDYLNCARVAALDTIEELSIGHAIISRAILVGLENAVREMAAIIHNAQL